MRNYIIIIYFIYNIYYTYVFDELILYLHNSVFAAPS